MRALESVAGRDGEDEAAATEDSRSDIFSMRAWMEERGEQEQGRKGEKNRKELGSLGK